MAFTDITGQRFGRLVAVQFVSGGRRPGWICRCDCGSEKLVDGAKLRNRHTVSCGCYRAERNRSGSITHGKSRHGKNPLYTVWGGMRARCNIPSATNYPRYGGRGITICGEWNDFEQFERWALASGYAEGLSIDRIDVNGNYEPANCRWATRREQSVNTSRTVLVEVDGITACVKDHAVRAGVSYWALIKLIRRTGLDAQGAVDQLRTTSTAPKS